MDYKLKKQLNPAFNPLKKRPAVKFQRPITVFSDLNINPKEQAFCSRSIRVLKSSLTDEHNK